MCDYNGCSEVYGGRKVGGIGVMKDKELKLKEIEASHTIGGSGESHVQGRGKWRGCRLCSDTLVSNTVPYSRTFLVSPISSEPGLGLVVITNGPV